MKVTQIHELLNTVTSEVLGTENIVKEDLTNLVDIGTEIIDADKVDNFVNKLVHHIGKVQFNNETYAGKAKNVLMDSWEFGAILQKIDAELPEAYENDSWKLVNGDSYDPNIFYQPKVSSQFFDSKVTFEIPISFAEKQVQGSFSNAEQMNGFLSMLINRVDTSFTIKLDELIMRTINNYIGAVVNAKDTNNSVNLLALYNTQRGKTLTVDKCLSDADFLRFANFTINTYIGRINRISSLFNIGKRERFTNVEDTNIILLDDFVNSSDVYLQADVRHNEFTGLKEVDTVPYWQGSGKSYAFSDISKIDVKINNGLAKGADVSQSGILGVLFDKKALGVTNLDKRVTTNYNAKAEFYTNFYKADSGYFNDFNQNFIVFYVSET